MQLTLFAVIVAALFCATAAQHSVPLRRRPIVHEYINTQYAGEVILGSERFQLVFDSSSDTLVVLSASCLSGACTCADLTKYYTSPTTIIGPSNTVENVTILDTGYAAGTETHDSITISTLKATNQGFLLAIDASQDLCTLRADGVVGMGRPKSGNAAFNLPTVLETYYNQGDIEYVFSFHHGRFPNGEHFGEIIFGGVDPRYITGVITTVPLVDSTTWRFKLDSINVGERRIVVNSVGLIDTSKYIVVGPEAQVNQINAALGCTNTRRGNAAICQFDCSKIDSLPPVTFAIGGRNFNISAEYHVQQNGDVCYSGFSPSKVTNTFLIGDFFIDHVVPIFNAANNTMGFAESVESL